MPDVYSIAMELNLDDKASEGLRAITEGLKSIVEQLALATEGFSKFNLAVAGAAGAGIVAGMLKISSAANEINKSLDQMRLGGLNAERALAAVNSVISVRPGQTREEVLSRLRTLQPLLGEAAYNPNVLTQLTRVEEQMRMQGVTGGLEPAIRLAMLRGARSPGEILSSLEQQTRMVQATQGQVTPQMIQNIVRQAGAAGQQWSPDFINQALPAFLLNVGAMTGGRMNAGRAMEMLDQAMLQPGMRGRGIGGALNRREFAAYMGRGVGVQDEAMMASDPARWARTVGAQIESQYGEAHMADVIRRMFTNPVIQQAMLFWMSAQGRAQQAQYGAQFARAGGTTPAAMMQLDADDANLIDTIGKRWHNLMTELARLNEPEYHKQLTWIDGVLDQMQKFVGQMNPRAVQVIIAALEGIGAAIAGLALVGGLGLLLPGGLVTLAVAGVAAAITILVGLEWDTLAKDLDTAWRAIRNFMTNIGLLGREEQTGPMGNVPAYRRGLAGIGNSLFGPQDYVDRNFPRRDELGVTGSAITPAQQVPSWLPQNFLPPAAENRGKDVNVAVDLNLDGYAFGTVLMQRILEKFDFPNGAPAANGANGWNPGDYNWQSR